MQFILFVSLCSLPFLKQSKCQSLCECSYWVKPTRSSGMPVSWRMVLKFWDPFLSRCVPSFSTTSPKCSRSKRPHRRTSWVVICTNRKKTPQKKDLCFYKIRSGVSIHLSVHTQMSLSHLRYFVIPVMYITPFFSHIGCFSFISMPPRNLCFITMNAKL